jgi:2-keto-4-pentenoate hydratase
MNPSATLAPTPLPAPSSPGAFDPAAAARLLADAWRSGRLLDALPADLRPRTLAEGYDAQDALLAETGQPSAGWKLGVGSPAALRNARLARPLVGRLPAAQVHADGATVWLPSRAPVTVEFEIAFVLGRDIAPHDAPPASPMDAVAAVHAAVELVRSRFVDRRAVGWPSFAADNVGFEALVLGRDALDAQALAAIRDSLVVSVDGAERARAVAGDDQVDPVEALGHLIDHARERGIPLARGQVVSTGTLCVPFDLPGRDCELLAEFAGRTLRLQTAVPPQD